MTRWKIPRIESVGKQSGNGVKVCMDKQPKMIKLLRKHRLPSVFCTFPWVRSGTAAFGYEDEALVLLHQQILAGKEDISKLDNLYSLMLAVDITENISDANNKRGFMGVDYYWNLSDVNYLLKGTKPSGAVSIEQAGFTEEQLALLAKEDSYLKYIRALEAHDSKPAGYYFAVELEDKIKSMERQMTAKGTLNRLFAGLRDNQRSNNFTSQAPKISESMRNEVLQYHDYTCIFDGRSRPEFTMHVHHVIPQRSIERFNLSERLFTARENLVSACSGCNIVKSDELSQADVRFYLAQFSNPTHPNHSLVKFLEQIRQLQQEA